MTAHRASCRCPRACRAVRPKPQLTWLLAASATRCVCGCVAVCVCTGVIGHALCGYSALRHVPTPCGPHPTPALQVLRAATSQNGVPLVKTFNESLPLWWAHPTSPKTDCMHYCQRSAPQLWTWRLYEQLQRNVGAVKGSKPAKASHWSKTIVAGPDVYSQ